ncbi:MAG: benzoate-CoA ligase family protein [Alphaproteobacteria bacterium]|jgi:2-aminobenzoate-CoA ligase|nr:2-aminobenzoate-CoA ligase [Rhodospirillaceae bacterium]MDP6405722.1 benzoate-CoA ligase family protein [Alphaproteobacteria bacterium]MDP6624673.1 benzoate-CoA ligase family protein [Alphaproteobacteria bacterium]
MLDPSAHLDSFARDNLPPGEEWAEMDWSSLPELAEYSKTINCASELLDRHIDEGNGARSVLHFGDLTWSYAELLDRANRIAHVLVDELGIKPGNRVLLRAPNNPMYVAVWFAVMKVGAVAVATMPLLRARELTFMADKARVAVALCDRRLDDELKQTLKDSACLERALYFSPTGEQTEAGSLEELMAEKSGDFANVMTSADDVALIAFTSGTTGQPKGCMHFHRDIMAICDTFSRYVLRPGPDDVFCGTPPVAFTFGLGALVTFPMHAGASTALIETPGPDVLLQCIQQHSATVCFTAPTMFRAMTGLVADHDISSLAKCVSAGETLPLPTFEAWRQATGISTIDGIGSTEMLHIFIAAAGDDIKPGATGKAIPGFEARVTDDDGNPVPAGTVGRLAVRGPTGCRYLDNPERQAAYVQDGWNYTGDAYLCDEDGYFWFQARADDMIISSGYNISGPEVEEAILDHDAVQECAVVASPDPERSFIVKAFVILREGAAAADSTVKVLQDHVKATIAPYKYPRAIEFVAELPRTETGKVQRFKLRQQELEKAGQAS